LTLGLGVGDNQICDSLNLRHLTTHQAEAYAGKTDKTIRRDLHHLEALGLIVVEKQGVRAKIELVTAFLPHQIRG